MAKKKEPAKPYYSVAHEYADSLEAFKHASMMLYTQVSTALSLAERENLTLEQYKKMLEMLREPAEDYRKAVHGD